MRVPIEKAEDPHENPVRDQDDFPEIDQRERNVQQGKKDDIEEAQAGEKKHTVCKGGENRKKEGHGSRNSPPGLARGEAQDDQKNNQAETDIADQPYCVCVIEQFNTHRIVSRIRMRGIDMGLDQMVGLPGQLGECEHEPDGKDDGQNKQPDILSGFSAHGFGLSPIQTTMPCISQWVSFALRAKSWPITRSSSIWAILRLPEHAFRNTDNGQLLQI